MLSTNPVMNQVYVMVKENSINFHNWLVVTGLYLSDMTTEELFELFVEETISLKDKSEDIVPKEKVFDFVTTEDF
jgi:hypothetical protein